MKDLFIAMFLVILSWLILCFIFIGIGLFIYRVFGLKTKHLRNPSIYSFWIGWAFIIFFLQIWHLFFKIDWRPFILILIVATAGLIKNCDRFASAIKKLSKNYLVCFATILLTLWLANRAIIAPTNGDSGLYHASAVRWAKSYPIVPGLGNLHGRLAFNSSYFLYVALIDFDFGKFTHKSYYLANGILLLILLTQIFLAIFNLLERKKKLEINNLFNSLLFYPTLLLALSPNLASPTPDLSIFVLGIILASELLFFLKNNTSQKEKEFSFFFIIVLSLLGITIKLNFLGPAIGVFSAILTIIFKKNYNFLLKNKKLAFLVGGITFLISVPWILRGIILSGYPVYPLSFGGLPVDWRIPKASVSYMAELICGWARSQGPGWQASLRNWQWLSLWIGRIIENPTVIFPLFLTFSSLVAMVLLTFKKCFNINKQVLAFLFLPFSWFIFWFFTTPDPRFAGSLFWIAFSISLSFVLIGFKFKNQRILITFFISFYLFLSLTEIILIGEKNFILKRDFNNLRIDKDLLVTKGGEASGFYKTPELKLKKFITNSGLTVYVPENDQCWDGPLPCTPYPNSNLSLREENNLGSGFKIKPRSENDLNVGIHL